eukprot:gnl/MRDRNA2_/MRDRNA2_67089_c0_seq1.p1 gnl/MRDRNA2_/MRDRNA2_67089_c0~~gnl/MRDRNA2_/MRDRNA2_67089_c0_seq1.p1  ORF type:complete len:381 (-),score=40.68 gnl/MRDRNA2_/MRDRNA2_67089_c0_seq1:272-1414(-)
MTLSIQSVGLVSLVIAMLSLAPHFPQIIHVVMSYRNLKSTDSTIASEKDTEQMWGGVEHSEYTMPTGTAMAPVTLRIPPGDPQPYFDLKDGRRIYELSVKFYADKISGKLAGSNIFEKLAGDYYILLDDVVEGGTTIRKTCNGQPVYRRIGKKPAMMLLTRAPKGEDDGCPPQYTWLIAPENPRGTLCIEEDLPAAADDVTILNLMGEPEYFIRSPQRVLAENYTTRFNGDTGSFTADYGIKELLWWSKESNTFVGKDSAKAAASDWVGDYQRLTYINKEGNDAHAANRFWQSEEAYACSKEHRWSVFKKKGGGYQSQTAMYTDHDIVGRLGDFHLMRSSFTHPNAVSQRRQMATTSAATSRTIQTVWGTSKVTIERAGS